MKLTMLGYWDGPHTQPGWPKVDGFVDPAWDEQERDLISQYLTHGQTVLWFMGMSVCRFCGVLNGNAEQTDGRYIWPEGVVHYVTEHNVRLPSEFVEHVLARDEEPIERDDTWWRGLAADASTTTL